MAEKAVRKARFKVTLGLSVIGKIFYPKQLDWPTLRDKKDWWIFDLAYEASVDFIVSRDKKVLSAGNTLGFKVLTLANVLKELETL
ncbi:MAG: hypothetical protein ACRCYY_20155 [Trueperaceae bacterium]